MAGREQALTCDVTNLMASISDLIDHLIDGRSDQHADQTATTVLVLATRCLCLTLPEGCSGAQINTVGGSQSESETKQRCSTSKGSTLQTGGNANRIATGGGEDSSILVRGSDIKAGNNITLEAAQDTFEQHSTNKSKCAAIGAAVTYGADGFAAGITASASGAWQGRW
ncbi:hypothetical protein LMG19144_00145 [Xanthomonas arboricola pv. fragariae]|nr:hypothetical protein LMG19144_00145 [Xanthomonas arboricola pv. fragariae]